MSPGFIGLRITSRDMALRWRARRPCSALSTLQTTSALVRNARFVECCWRRSRRSWRNARGRTTRESRREAERERCAREDGRRTVCMKIKFITIKSFTTGTRAYADARQARTTCALARDPKRVRPDEISFNAISRTRGIERRYLLVVCRTRGSKSSVA